MSEGEERHRAVMLNRNGSKPCEPSTSVTNRASSTIAKTEKRLEPTLRQLQMRHCSDVARLTSVGATDRPYTARVSCDAERLSEL